MRIFENMNFIWLYGGTASKPIYLIRVNMGAKTALLPEHSDSDVSFCFDLHISKAYDDTSEL